MLCATQRMSEDALIRLENLLAYARRKGWRDKQLAEAIGRKPQQLSDMRHGRRGFGEDLARDIEERLKLPRYWLDVPHDSGEGGQLDQAAEQMLADHAKADRSALSTLAMHLALEIDKISDPEIKTKAFAAAVLAIHQVAG